jgi:hypothetical protein
MCSLWVSVASSLACDHLVLEIVLANVLVIETVIFPSGACSASRSGTDLMPVGSP